MGTPSRLPDKLFAKQTKGVTRYVTSTPRPQRRALPGIQLLPAPTRTVRGSHTAPHFIFLGCYDCGAGVQGCRHGDLRPSPARGRWRSHYHLTLGAVNLFSPSRSFLMQHTGTSLAAVGVGGSTVWGAWRGGEGWGGLGRGVAERGGAGRGIGRIRIASRTGRTHLTQLF